MRVLNLLMVVLATATSLFACQPKGPIGKELYDLRGKCAKAAEDRRQPAFATGFFGVFLSHYDVKTGRCILYISYAVTPKAFADSIPPGTTYLVDAQTNAVLAAINKGEITVHSKVVSKDRFDTFVKEQLGDDSF